MLILLILLLCLILFDILSYYLFKSFTSPSFISGVFLSIGTFFAILGNIYWKVNIGFCLLIVIIFGMSSLLIGELLARCFYNQTRNKNNKQYSYQKGRKNISKYFTFIISILAFISFIIYFREQVQLATFYGYRGENIFKWIRISHYTSSVENSNLVKLLLVFLKTMGYIYTFTFLYNLIYFDKKIKISNISNLLPVFLFLLSEVVSAARSGILKWILFTICVALIFISKIKYIKFSKLAFKLSICIIVALIIFSLLGILTTKTNEENFFENIKIYIGSSIVALGQYLNDFGLEARGTSESFIGLKLLLDKSYGNNAVYYSLEGIKFANGYGTNIYTSFRSYISDYGIIGLLVIPFIIGIIFGYVHSYVTLNSKTVSFGVFIYSYYAFEIVSVLFTPALTSSFLTVGRIINFVALYIIYIIIFDLNWFCNDSKKYEFMPITN